MNIATFEEMFNSGVKSYHNRTKVYLAPMLNYYGDTFRSLIRKLETTAVGIADILEKTDNKYCLYFLVNTKKDKLKVFDGVLHMLKSYSFFVKDYPFGEIFNNQLHMLVFEIPEELHGAYDAFLDSKYSKMLTTEQIDILFNRVYGKTAAVQVMTKDPEYRVKFEERVNSLSATSEKSTWITLPEDAELDFVIQLEQEVFNYVGGVEEQEEEQEEKLEIEN
jgi:hypothetical protein